MEKRLLLFLMVFIVVGISLNGCGTSTQTKMLETVPPPPLAKVSAPETKKEIPVAAAPAPEIKKEAPLPSVPAPAPKKKKKG